MVSANDDNSSYCVIQYNCGCKRWRVKSFSD